MASRRLVTSAACLLAACIAVLTAPLGVVELAEAQTASEPPFAASFFHQRLPSDAALDPESAAMVRQVRNLAFGVDPATEMNCRAAVMKPEHAWSTEEQSSCAKVVTRAGIAYDGSAPVVYRVGADQPRLPVVLDGGEPHLKRAFAAGAPIPTGAVSSPGTDGQLIVWQPSSDTMWEFWRAKQDATGTWHASWGGRMQNVSQSPGHFRDIADPSGGFAERHTWGGPASSIPNLPGLITIEELRAGEIDHALVFSTWTNKPAEWVYPAQRTDGACRGPGGIYCADIPQGARFRLDPTFDTAQIRHPVVRMITEAVQEYGMVLSNKTGGGVAFYTEGWRSHGSEDPYFGPEGLLARDPKQRQPTLFMREFPWEDLQMLRRGTVCTVFALECPAPADWLAGAPLEPSPPLDSDSGQGVGSQPSPSASTEASTPQSTGMESQPSPPPSSDSGQGVGSEPSSSASPEAGTPQSTDLELLHVRRHGSRLQVEGRINPAVLGHVAVRIAAPSAGAGRINKTRRAPVSGGRFETGFRVSEAQTRRVEVSATYVGTDFPPASVSRSISLRRG